MTYTDDERLELELSILLRHGVDNWEWFEESTDGLSLSEDDWSEIMNALKVGGVDNWDGYSVIGYVDEYIEYLGNNPDNQLEYEEFVEDIGGSLY